MRKYLDPDLIWPQVAGLIALFDVDGKLTRKGLSAVDLDGKVSNVQLSFILDGILEAGIGIYYLSQN